MAEYIREVEKIIDAYHKQNPLFESILRDQSTGLKFPPVQDLSLANSKLIASIKFQDGCISYSTDESIWDSFYVLRNADISRWIFQQLCVAAHP